MVGRGQCGSTRFGPLCHPGKAVPATSLPGLSRPSSLLPSTSALWPPSVLSSLATTTPPASSSSSRRREKCAIVRTVIWWLRFGEVCEEPVQSATASAQNTAPSGFLCLACNPKTQHPTSPLNFDLDQQAKKKKKNRERDIRDVVVNGRRNSEICLPTQISLLSDIPRPLNQNPNKA
ncbi:hypothetical protein ACFX1X_032108 [Malus domestica]